LGSVDGETYTSFGIGGNAVTKSWAVAPLSNGAQNSRIFIRSGAVKHERAVHVSV
jgi:hypothetical protein